MDFTNSWDLFEYLGDHESGLGHYLQAELVATHKAMDIMKSLDIGEKISFHDWITACIEYANQFSEIGAKYRDFFPRLLILQKNGLVTISDDPEKDWNTAMVSITAKGYLTDNTLLNKVFCGD